MKKGNAARQNIENKPLSKKRMWLFRTIAILLPFLVLLLLEIGLRIFHYGYNMDLFVEYPGRKEFLVLNPSASKKYFVNQMLAPSGNREVFKKIKDKNTTRIFVLGESTTIGYPYFHNGSFTRWLQYRLINNFPDRNFEIINLSLTAVNSYTVLDFAQQIINYEPDAVLIYTGHNEYYGALGVASTNNISSNPKLIKLLLQLRKLRITQLFTSIYQKMARSSSGGQKNGNQTLMQRMVKDQQISFESDLYNKGVQQFSENIDGVLKLFNKHHIPVLISNLVSNEDFKPFISESIDSLRFPGFTNEYELGMSFFWDNDFINAKSHLANADKIYRGHALCNFYLGKLAYLNRDFKAAKGYFDIARDLDGLRFRAPAVFNEIISQLCKKYQYAYLVDTRSAFDSCANNHIVGDDLMLEHVHPNLRGYAVMSDVFYRVMEKAGLISENTDAEMSISKLMEYMPITPVDSLAGVYKIAKLKSSWPFNEPVGPNNFSVSTIEERLAHEMEDNQIHWPDAMDSLYNYYMSVKNISGARTVLESIVLEHPEEPSVYDRAGMICGEMNDLPAAAIYFHRSFSFVPSVEKAKYLFVIYFKLDRPEEAMRYLDYSIQNSGMSTNLQPIKYFAGEIIQLKKQFAIDTASENIPVKIAEKYFRMGNKDLAISYLEKALVKNRNNKEALVLLSEIKTN